MSDAILPHSDHARRRVLSVVLPAFNEQDVLPLTHARLQSLTPALDQLGFDLELVFVNDGSRDRTGELLDEFAHRDPRVRAVHLTRNFGHQAAISAGLSVARGDVVALMDADLQDPPEQLPRFLEQWASGYQVVYAIRTGRKEWFGKRMAYWAFYRLMNLVAELDIPLDSGDFCVMDRRAVDLLNSLPERQRFVRGLRTWVGLKQTGLTVERDARAAGRPAYTFRGLVKLAIDGLVSFSSTPLKLLTRLGLLFLVVAFALGLWVIIGSFIDLQAPRGWASLACIVLFASSVQMIALGVMGEYMARIFLEVKGRPTFMIASITETAPAATGVRT
jgi:dolichol-phosphate mannosyltransferase